MSNCYQYVWRVICISYLFFFEAVLLLIVMSVFTFPSLPNKQQFVCCLVWNIDCHKVFLSTLNRGDSGHMNRWSASCYPPNSHLPSYFILLFYITRCPSVSILSLFSLDHDRWLPGGKFSFGSYHICELCPFISSFPHKSILITSGVCDRLIVVFRK